MMKMETHAAPIRTVTPPESGPDRIGSAEDGEDGDRQELMRIRVDEPGYYLLEVLTADEWSALHAEDRPAEFFAFRPDCRVRIRPE